MTAKSNRREITINRQKYKSIGSAASAHGLSRNTVDYRLSKRWTPEQAVGLEPRPSNSASTPGVPVIVQGHEFNSIRQAAAYFGRSYTHIFAKLKKGCTIEQALGLLRRTDSLKSECPELAEQWHPTRNYPLAAQSVTSGSGKKVWWLCAGGHEWRAVVNSRTRGMGCPYCAGQKPTADRNFATGYPDLVKEWDSKKNGNKKPEDFTPRSGSRVWWRCEKGHSWQATISNRTRDFKKSICPTVATGNCLKTITWPRFVQTLLNSGTHVRIYL